MFKVYQIKFWNTSVSCKNSPKAIIEMAEGVGFELTELFTLAGFQDRYLKPLGHPSTYVILA